MTEDPRVRVVADRDSIAEAALGLLSSDRRIEAARLGGSLGTGTADVFSDIDLVVQAARGSDRELAVLVPDVLAPLGPFTVVGWGLGALPETYVRSLFPERSPLLWHIDVECSAAQHIDGADISARYHWHVVFVMWLNTLKRQLRDPADGARAVEDFKEHVARRSDVSQVAGSLQSQLRQLLELLKERTLTRGVAAQEAAPLFSRPDEVCASFL